MFGIDDDGLGGTAIGLTQQPAPPPVQSRFRELTASFRLLGTLKWRRYWKGTLVQILLPVLVLGGLAALSKRQSTETIPAVNYVSDGPPASIEPQFSEFGCLNTTSPTVGKDFSATSISYLRLVLPNCTVFLESNRARVLRCSEHAFDAGEVPVTDLCADISRTSSALLGYFANFTEPSSIPSVDAMVLSQWLFRTAYRAMNVRFGRPDTRRALEITGRVFFSPKTRSLDDAAAVMRVAKLLNQSDLFSSFIYGKIFTDVQSAEAELTSTTGEGKAWALIVIGGNTTTVAKGTTDEEIVLNQLDVELRFNKSAIPWTHQILERFQGGLKQYYKQYAASGFVSLQKEILQDFVLDYQKHERFAAQSGKKVMNSLLVAVPMPALEHRLSLFLGVAKRIAPLGLTLAFLYPVSQLCRSLVDEKERKIRETIAVMGAAKGVLQLAWQLNYLPQHFVTAIVMTVILNRSFVDRSDPSLIFVVTLMFTISTSGMAAIFSSFFGKARTAAVAAPVLFFALSLPSFALPEDVSPAILKGLLLLSPSAYAQGLGLIFSYELGNGIGWNDFSNVNDTVQLSEIFFALLFASVGYPFFAFYFDTVLGASEWGTRRNPCFCVTDCCAGWWRRYQAHRAAMADAQHGEHSDASTPFLDRKNEKEEKTVSGVFEPYRREMLPTVRIENLRKEFSAARAAAHHQAEEGDASDADAIEQSGDKITAVDNFSLQLFPGQIMILLGHNSSGKTTLFNLITGMLQPSSGDSYVLGHSIVNDIDAARRHIGICPQHNVLWEDLTCLEHLLYFARMKGVRNPEEEARRLLAQLEMPSKVHAPASTLSGGQKRKLSVAASFIGGASFVLLDEATAGMDAGARRCTWQLLRNMSRNGRTILLTTHFMDEADILGDRISILKAGKLHSSGSPTYLKSKLGEGYTLRITFADSAVGSPALRNNSNDDTQDITVVADEVQKIVVNELDAGNIPEKISSSVVVKEAAGREATLLVPIAASAAFGRVIRTLQSHPNLGVVDIAVSVATIEDIFLKIAEPQQSSPSETAISATVLSADAKTALNLCFAAGSEHPVPSFGSQLVGLMLKRFRVARRDKRTLFLTFALPILSILFAMALSGVGPPATTRLEMTSSMFPNPQQEILLSPSCFGPLDEYLAQAGYRTVNVTPSMIINAVRGTVIKNWSNGGIDPVTGTRSTSAVGLSQFLLSTGKLHGNTERYVAYSCDDFSQRVLLPPFETLSPSNQAVNTSSLHWPFTPSSSWNLSNSTSVLFINSSTFHGFPLAVSDWFAAQISYLQPNSSDPRFVVSANPLPFTVREQQLIDSTVMALMAIFILIPFTFVPSTYAGFVVKERECQAKLLQFVSGASYAAYWASNILFDFLSFLVTMFLALALFGIFKRTEYVEGEAFGITLFIFVMYAVAAIPTAYVFAFPFKTPGSAQDAVMGIFFVTGFVLTLTGFFLRMLQMDISILWAFRIFPAYCLGELLLTVANAPGRRQLGVTVNLFDLDELGYPFLYLAGVAVIMYTFLLVADHPIWKTRANKAEKEAVQGKNESDEMMKTHSAYDEDPPDVALERKVVTEAVQKGRASPFLAAFVGLQKIYPSSSEGNDEVDRGGKKRSPARDDGFFRRNLVAVDNLTFGVQPGEIFGFLGVNGSGKSSTISVAAGHLRPTRGGFVINPFAGNESLNSSHEPKDTKKNSEEDFRLLGYVPQFDGHLDLLSANEHLDLFCRLRGVAPASRRSAVINGLLLALDLVAVQDRPSKHLSGGNRRKLSLAMALIGGPRVLLLDECTAGMDPVVRRRVWGILSYIVALGVPPGSPHSPKPSTMVTNILPCSIILSTHHLEEADVLAHRAAVMVRGRMRCIGTVEHLRKTVGGGYRIHFRVDSVRAGKYSIQLFSKLYPTAVVTERNITRVVLTLPVHSENFSLADIFDTLNQMKSRGGMILDYTLAPATMEQVFTAVTSSSEPTDEISEDDDAQDIDDDVITNALRDMSESPAQGFGKVDLGTFGKKVLSATEGDCRVANPMGLQRRARSSATSSCNGEPQQPMIGDDDL